MPDLLVMPAAERLVIDHLNAAMVEPVSLTIPNPRPATFLTVQRTGGPRLNLVADNATLTLEAWGNGPTTAERLLARARALMLAMRGQVIAGVSVYRVAEVGGPGFLPDPDSTQARYTMTVQVALRGAHQEV